MILTEDGLVHIGDDGVARSYAADGVVLDYFPLSNVEIMTMSESMVENANITDAQQIREHLYTVFEGVTGHDVSEEVMAHPTENILPYQLRGGRTLLSAFDTALESANVKEANKIFERQLGFCQSQWCLNSVGCLIAGCGPCVGVDEVGKIMSCSLP